MKGTIEFINAKKGFFGVRVYDDDYSVIELIDIFGIESGDIVSGKLQSIGPGIILNITQNHLMNVYVQGIEVSARAAREHVFR